VGDVDRALGRQADPRLPGARGHQLRSFTDHERNFSDYFLYIHVINIESRGQTGHHGTLWRKKVGHGK
jgi:hypothetical protein